MIDEKNIDDYELEELLEEIIDKYSKYDERLSSIAIFWVKEGVIYKSFYEASWLRKLNSKVEEIIDIHVEKKWKERREKFPHSQKVRSRIADTIAKHPDYLKYSTRHNKLEAIIEQILIDEDVDINKNNNLPIVRKIIKPEANRIFEREYKIKSEEFLIKQISAMLKKGYSKSETIAKLDITESLYLKYNLR